MLTVIRSRLKRFFPVFCFWSISVDTRATQTSSTHSDRNPNDCRSCSITVLCSLTLSSTDICEKHPFILIPFLLACRGDVIAAVLQAGQHNRAVMVPAADGGYVALLLRDHDISLFSDIAWGRESVARTTISRLQALHWDFSVLPGCPDIDRPEDLNCLVEIPALAHWAKR